MSYFDFGKWKDKNAVMHCATEEEANDFCRVMHEAGAKWCDGELYVEDTMWRTFKKKTIYFFNDGTHNCIEEAVHKNYTILKWSDYMKKEFTKQDLKNGDVCVLRNGAAVIAIPEIDILRGKIGLNYLKNYFDNLKGKTGSMLDIIRVYRPKVGFQCSWDAHVFTEGELVYDREKFEPVEVTIEEIAELKGVSADRIKIVKK